MSDVVGGCKLGDPGAQRILYEQYYAFALSTCIRYTSNYDEAREVMNDGFVKVFKHIPHFIEPGSNEALSKLFMSWLKKIMINTAINHSAARQSKLRLMAADDFPEENERWEAPVTKLAYEDLIKMVQKLTPAYRNVFNLHVIEGFKHEEISGMLGISVGASKSNLLKARKNLRQMLEEIYEEKV